MGVLEKLGTRKMPPVGMGFRPEEDEIIYYLKRKLQGVRENWLLVPDLDIYQREPQALFKKYDEMSDQPSDGRKCFFFCIRNGNNRMTGTGYWKETRKRRIIKGRDGNPIGSKNILVYYEGRQPKGRKSHYSMHEYHLFSPSKPKTKGPKMELVLCRIINKEYTIASPDSLLSDPDPVSPRSSTTASHLDYIASPQDKIASPDSLLSDPDPVSHGSSTTASHLDYIASPQIHGGTVTAENEDVITMEMMQEYESKGYSEPLLQLSYTDPFHADGLSSSSRTAFDPSAFSLDDNWVSEFDLVGPL